jgi:GNAT superfamily N-acetyltransferase
VNEPSIVERNVDLAMARLDLRAIPRYVVPAGYAIRPYAPGDERAWVEIQEVADVYNEISPELFRREYGDDAFELGRRLFMLQGPSGAAIGTAAAWTHDPDGRIGRLHWVAIHPAHQGRGLAKPLLSHVCAVMRDLGHVAAHLTTSSARVPAIALYLHFGFVPATAGPDDAAAWAELRRVPILAHRLRDAAS